MYDLIIDLHRDSVNREKTTVHTNGNDYARVAFVVGLEHQNYKENEAKAIALKREMEKLVPGITRNIIRKSGVGVDGIYNQDLNENIILVELGGKENKEAELNNTITILGQAIDNLFRLETIDEN